MKYLVLSTAILIGLFFSSCNSSTTNKGAENASATSSSNVTSYNLDDLLKIAGDNIDKKVKVVGYITHTCKHSGKRCFIVGDSQKASMRVEAKGNIGGFNRELTGSKVEIEGTVKERRISKEYIDQMEKDVNAKAEDGSAESCQAELSNISQMRDWMAANGKDYYSIYFMDGEEYEVVN